jgi:UDP-N-acetyl-D-glucosamine dehydrogenase
MNLEKLIKNKKAKVAIIGLGYVGLPTAVELAEVGYQVLGVDMEKTKVDQINRGKSYVSDVSDKELQGVINSKKLRSFHNYQPLKKADIVLICVPTPLDENKNPDISYIAVAADEIIKYLHKGQLVILESTTYPGATREVILPKLEKSNLKVGKDFFLAFSPERIDPGNKKYKLEDIPRVVGGITKRCAEIATKFYQSFIKAETLTLSSPEAAEMTKLLENTFRLVNISMINELALLCDKMKVDIWEIIEAAKTKPYGFMPFYPSPKIGGHCIPLVPFFLSYKAKEYNFWTRFIDLAGEINEQMPHFVITKVFSALNKNKKSINDSKILVLGVAYKKDIGDVRESAAFNVIFDLLRKRAKVDYYDPFVKKIKVGKKVLKSINYKPGILKSYDLVLILTDHSRLDYEEIAKKAKLVVDTRNAVKSRRRKNIYRI